MINRKYKYARAGKKTFEPSFARSWGLCPTASRDCRAPPPPNHFAPYNLWIYHVVKCKKPIVRLHNFISQTWNEDRGKMSFEFLLINLSPLDNFIQVTVNAHICKDIFKVFSFKTMTYSLKVGQGHNKMYEIHLVRLLSPALTVKTKINKRLYVISLWSLHSSVTLLVHPSIPLTLDSIVTSDRLTLKRNHLSADSADKTTHWETIQQSGMSVTAWTKKIIAPPYLHVCVNNNWFLHLRNDLGYTTR